MDFIDIANQKKLYVGTNRGVILTIDITNLLAMELEDEYDLDGMDMEMDMDMDYMEEQINSSKNKKKGKRYEEFDNDGPSMTHQQLIDNQK